MILNEFFYKYPYYLQPLFVTDYRGNHKVGDYYSTNGSVERYQE